MFSQGQEVSDDRRLIRFTFEADHEQLRMGSRSLQYVGSRRFLGKPEVHGGPAQSSHSSLDIACLAIVFHRHHIRGPRDLVGVEEDSFV